VLQLTSDNPVLNPGFDADLSGWGCWFPSKQSGDQCVDPNPEMTWSPGCGINGGCLWAKGNETEQVLVSSNNDIAVSAGTSYLAQFMTLADQERQQGTVVVRKTGVSYDQLGLSRDYAAGTLVDYHFYGFQALEDFATARIDFRVDVRHGMHLDDVEVRGVELIYNDRAPNSALIVNTSPSPLALEQCEVVLGTVTEGEDYIGLDELPVVWSKVLEPTEAEIVVRSDHDFIDHDNDGVPDKDIGDGIYDLCPDTPGVQTSNYEGCSHYQLIGEPCTGVVCEPMDPAAECLDALTLRVYEAAQCVEGHCEYPFSDTLCDNGCLNGACTPGDDTNIDDSLPSDKTSSCGCGQVGSDSSRSFVLVELFRL
jgi:hypothetical protein